MKKAFVAIAMIIPVLISSFIFVTPDRDKSELENRTLKTKSQIRAADFQNGLESYLSDQFPLRDGICAMRSRLALAEGKRDINGAYVGDGRLFQRITEADVNKSACISSARTLSRIAGQIPAYALYIGSAGVVLTDEMPANAPMYDYKALRTALEAELDGVTIIEPDCQSYYKTDHHWTAQGAYSAYVQWCRAHNTEPREYQLRTVSDDFRGSLYSRVLLSDIPADTIEAPVIDCNIEATADGMPLTLFDESALATKDKYSYFLGGNHGIVTITNKDNPRGRRLLIIRDSFADSFVPYIIEDYSQIIMLDERYCLDSPEAIIKAQHIDEVAVIKEIIS